MKRFLLLATIAAALSSCCKLHITDKGRTDYRIVIAQDADEITRLAATRLHDYIAKISGAEMSVISDAEEAVPHEIVIGVTNRPGTDGYDRSQLEADGFEIFARGKTLYLVGGYAKGNLNAVYGLLDDFLGCRLYAEHFEILPEEPSITLPADIATKQVPIITYRSASYTPTFHPKYIEWHRYNHGVGGNNEQWGLWVHTFNRLVPPKEYLETHPEYYALVRGNRQFSQLCLSNPDVFEILCKNLAKEMEEKPWALYWSVSQNDNTEYCQCDECKKADAIDGGPTGSVIQFTNKVAERFPDKIISTLAYQYSRSAPTTTKPRDNVNIMFCNIECNRAKPIATDPTSESFRKDMEDWAKLTDNIIVWDYVIQFANLVSPFPNLHTLQPNLQFFVDNSVVAMFEQGNREVGGEFADLRSYLVTKLMWNPYYDVDSLMTDFCNGYYGAGGPYVQEYIADITAGLEESGRFLGIFENPCMPADSYLSPAKLKDYHAYFEQAEAAVAEDPQRLFHVKVSRQPLYYAQIEQARFDPHGPNGIFYVTDEGKSAVKPEFKKMFDNFIALCKEEGVTRLSEWHTTPDDYNKIIYDIMNMQVDGNKAFKKPVTFNVRPDQRYDLNAATQLTDGVFGTDDFRNGWLGWEVPEFEVTVDLGSVQSVGRYTTRFMQNFDLWLFFPLSVEYLASSDGVNFTTLGKVKREIDRSRPAATEKYQIGKKTDARYVKAVVKGAGICPEWHQGAGGKAFVFMDEFTVE